MLPNFFTVIRGHFLGRANNYREFPIHGDSSKKIRSMCVVATLNQHKENNYNLLTY